MKWRFLYNTVYQLSSAAISTKKTINVTVFYSSVTNTRKLHLGLFRKLPYTEKKRGKCNMSKTKQPLYDSKTGIHRAKGWEIALYALNNLSTNLYGMAFLYVSYFLVGIVGTSVAFAGILAAILRVFDGVTDPIIGFVVDKTNGKFGKNRPFIVLGQLIMAVSTAFIFIVCPMLPQTGRLLFYIVFYAIYIIGYTAQCIVTKSAQTCLTNDPKQRPLFTVYDSIYSILILSLLPVYITSFMVPKFNVYDASGNITVDAFSNPDFFRSLWVICAVLSAICAVCAVLGLWRKDRKEFFGTGKPQLLRLRDYVEVLKNNRAIQMLCVSACSDKLTMNMQRNAIVTTMLFGIIIGDYSQYAVFSGITGLMGVIVPVLLIIFVARNMGQKQALLVGTWGGIGVAIILFCMLRFGNPTLVNFSHLNLYTILFVLLYIIMTGFGSLSGSIVIPMTADCADYEVYRSGRYVPGLMGTLFSFIDKIISSFSTAIIGLLLAMIGFKDTQPTYTTPYSEPIFWVTVFCFLGAPVIGWILNVIAMKFYPLTKEMMTSIQEKIAEIKAENIES